MTDFNTQGIQRVLNWAFAPSPCAGTIGRGDDAANPKETGQNNIQVLAKLIAMNGFSPKVLKWGVFEGPLGLAQPEAFLLMEMGPFFQGLIDGSGVDPESASNLLHPELTRWADLWEARDAAAAAALVDAVIPAPAEVSAQ